MTKEEYLLYSQGIYRATRGLMAVTPEDKLDFNPAKGLMTIAQILKHLSGALGDSLSMAIDNRWPELPEGDMLPPAEKMPKSGSVTRAIEDIDRDWKLLESEFVRLTDEQFNTVKVNVPWMPMPVTYVDYMMQAMEHLSNHRMQLFIWLKLAGENLNTGHLYGLV